MRFLRHRPAGLLTLLVTGLLAGCASIGAPVPPSLELPRPPADLRAVRKGDGVYLYWTVPAQTTDRQSVRRRGPTWICRSLEALMSQCGTPVGEMPPGAAVSRNNGKQEASYVDTLPHELEQQNPDRLITYAVEARNDSGRAAGLSNQVQIPLAPTLPPPPNFKAELTASGVALSWECEPPPSTADRVRYTYRIYRRSVDSGADVKLADVDCPDSRFVDDTFEWQKSYEYRITVVTSVNLGPLHACSTKGPAEQGFSDCVEVATVEGDDSPAQKIVTNDVFPPGVPSGLQAVFSGPGQRAFVDLVWAPDTDADLAGYKVYRREEGSQPAKINAELVKTPAFRDANVAAGKTYWYSVSAVDLRGNESTRSEESSEQVP